MKPHSKEAKGKKKESEKRNNIERESRQKGEMYVILRVIMGELHIGLNIQA